jgi:hypothetical protein
MKHKISVDRNMIKQLRKQTITLAQRLDIFATVFMTSAIVLFLLFSMAWPLPFLFYGFCVCFIIGFVLAIIKAVLGNIANGMAYRLGKVEKLDFVTSYIFLILFLLGLVIAVWYLLH